jgi:2-methylcitrate dehydratase PrpD
MLDALGTAGTQAAGLWEFNADGAMSKHLHPGKAALNGILAADLAKLGFTGATRILEGDRGFFRAMAASFDASRVTDRLGERWLILENCYKLHSCCAHTHTAIDVALDIRARRDWSGQSALAAIERIDLETYAAGYEIVSDPNPTTPYRAKFSLAYCVAAALVEGQVGLDQFSPERFGEDGVLDARIASLLSRIRVTVRDDLSARYPARWPTNVVIALRDGTVERGMNDYPRGNPENPVSTETLEQKFIALVAPRHGVAFAERAVGVARRLGDCADVRPVVSELFA